MKVVTKRIGLKTKGEMDIIDITNEVGVQSERKG